MLPLLYVVGSVISYLKDLRLNKNDFVYVRRLAKGQFGEVCGYFKLYLCFRTFSVNRIFIRRVGFSCSGQIR